MGKARFQELEHTADLAIRVWGKDLPELFANAAYGMFSLMVEVDKLGTEAEHIVSLQAVDREALLVDWLSELLTLHDTHRQAYREFLIRNLFLDEEGAKLEAIALGGKIEGVKIVIKGVTYHDLHIEETPQGYTTALVFDI
ncbi:MAG: archease [Chloroflexi bacterium]|nr:archease [Chloroflexota bacterium]